MEIVELYLNSLTRKVSYKGIEKLISDEYWDEHINSLLYPLWSTDKDRLEIFAKKKDGTYLIIKNRYVKDHKAGKYKWITEEDDVNEFSNNELNSLYSNIRQKFLEYKDIENKNIETLLRKEYSKSNSLNWNKVLMLIKFLLRDCDWTQLSDSGLSRKDKTLWVMYRKKLKSIPEDYKTYPPSNIKWPITPIKYKEIEDNKHEYLKDIYGHYYMLNSKIILNLAERIIHYFTIIASFQLIDEDKIVRLNKNTRPFIPVDMDEVSIEQVIDYVTNHTSGYNLSTVDDVINAVIDSNI